MLRKISQLYKLLCEEGMRLPFVYDASSGKPSVTLMFVYVTFFLALSSTILLHVFDNLLTATITSIVFWMAAYVMYRLRRLDSAKINFEEKSIELSSNDETNQGKSNED